MDGDGDREQHTWTKEGVLEATSLPFADADGVLTASVDDRAFKALLVETTGVVIAGAVVFVAAVSSLPSFPLPLLPLSDFPIDAALGEVEAVFVDAGTSFTTLSEVGIKMDRTMLALSLLDAADGMAEVTALVGVVN